MQEFKENQVNKKSGVIEEKDLDKFAFTHNRPINKLRVEKLAERIKQKNLLADYPILVNDKMEVIDGQTRLEAARLLGCAIYYRHAEAGLEVIDIARANQATTPWKWEDYLEFYAGQGIQGYIELRELWRANRTGLSLANLAVIATDAGSGTRNKVSQDFKDGLYAPTKFDFAMSILLEAEELIRVAGFAARQRTFISAYAAVRKYVPEFDPSRFLARIKLIASPISRTGQTLQVLKDIERIYNWRMGEQNRLDMRAALREYLTHQGWTW
jgi:hypothetical protein